ncbi:MAG: FAD-binding oxidoreductase [Desulfurococcales archaeon]|nr:FAD-binding oxidoreductase [Desulfurococcales archaeon]MEB3799117.1 FAD-binding oxidoreductase [Desulfurococcales archaeon]
MSLDKFFEEATGLLGSRWVLLSDWQRYPYSRDYWPILVYKELSGGRASLPSGVVLPGSEGEVVELLELAGRHGVQIVAYGGGSGVLGGAVPDKNWVVMDLSRLDWIDWYDEESGIVDVGAGVYLKTLEEWLNKQGKTLRHFPQSFPEAVIGGLISTRSIGQYSTGYGGIEDLVRGLNVAVPSVGLVRIKPSPRRSVLLPLEQMFIGGEGLYGVITRAYLSAYDLPECSEKVGWISASFKNSLGNARSIVRRRIPPDLFRVYDEKESPLHFGVDGSVSIGVVEGECNVVEAKIEGIGKIVNADPWEGAELADKWLSKRFNVISDLWKLYELGMGFETIEISVPWGSAYDLYDSSMKSLGKLDRVFFTGVHASHFYQSGVALYYTIAYSLENIGDTYNSIWDTLMGEVSKHSASISHHHGVGRMRAKYLEAEYGPSGTELLSKLKNCLDPTSILRDKFFGGKS